MLFAEVLQGDLGDVRGLIWPSLPGVSNYVSGLPPNGTKHLWLNDGGDALPSSLCVADAGQKLPCIGDPADATAMFRDHAGTRSRHPGGVNALLGDGAVRFIKNTISPGIWVAIHSIAGSKVVSADAFQTQGLNDSVRLARFCLESLPIAIWKLLIFEPRC